MLHPVVRQNSETPADAGHTNNTKPVGCGLKTTAVNFTHKWSTFIYNSSINIFIKLYKSTITIKSYTKKKQQKKRDSRTISIKWYVFLQNKNNHRIDFAD